MHRAYSNKYCMHGRKGGKTPCLAEYQEYSLALSYLYLLLDMQVMAPTLDVSRPSGCLASAVTCASVHVLLLSVQPHSMLMSALCWDMRFMVHRGLIIVT